ncbi:MAG: hypothetical protein IJT06_00535, partial [Selenomonadaceae bacterium]|nr:hypothetical protein [Selenomonadaceae bacterium]
ELYYLYSQGTRLWFSVNPTLRKLVEEKREKYSDDEIDFEIEQRLAKWKGKGLFKAVHFCPKNSSDVADEQTARLVIFAPKYFYDENQKDTSPAMVFAKNILDTRGTIPRTHKNMLLFLAADYERLVTLKKIVREFKAWHEILEDSKKGTLNLDRLQQIDTESNCNLTEKNFEMKISQAYCKIFAPSLPDSSDNLNEMQLNTEEIECIKEENIQFASEKFAKDEKLLKSLGDKMLKKSLDEYIWRTSDTVQLGKLWDYFTTYYYMPRLIEKNVLIETVRKGVAEKTFALADGEDLQNLQFGEKISGEISAEKFLVKESVAKKILEAEKEPDEPEEKIIVPIEPEPPSTPATEKPKPIPKRFVMDVDLDITRLKKNFNDCNNEIIEYFTCIPEAQISVHLSVSITVPGGIPEYLRDNTEANCNDLHIENFHFED